MAFVRYGKINFDGSFIVDFDGGFIVVDFHVRLTKCSDGFASDGACILLQSKNVVCRARVLWDDNSAPRVLTREECDVAATMMFAMVQSQGRIPEHLLDADRNGVSQALARLLLSDVMKPLQPRILMPGEVVRAEAEQPTVRHGYKAGKSDKSLENWCHDALAFADALVRPPVEPADETSALVGQWRDRRTGKLIQVEAVSRTHVRWWVIDSHFGPYENHADYIRRAEARGDWTREPAEPTGRTVDEILRDPPREVLDGFAQKRGKTWERFCRELAARHEWESMARRRHDRGAPILIEAGHVKACVAAATKE